jgi:hypothetical protein
MGEDRGWIIEDSEETRLPAILNPPSSILAAAALRR